MKSIIKDHGSDGRAVITIGDKVVRKTVHTNNHNLFAYMSGFLDMLVGEHYRDVVPVLSRNTAKSALFVCEYTWSYTMPRLAHLWDDEEHVVNLIADDCDGAGLLDLTDRQRDAAMSIVNQSSQYEELVGFCNRIIDLGYEDLHDENVMTDKNGQYRIIDLEAFYDGQEEDFVYPKLDKE